MGQALLQQLQQLFHQKQLLRELHQLGPSLSHQLSPRQQLLHQLSQLHQLGPASPHHLSPSEQLLNQLSPMPYQLQKLLQQQHDWASSSTS